MPPPGYGGIEQVVELLSLELLRRGHEVTMYAAPVSRSPADIKSPRAESHPDEIEQAIYEADHVASAFDSIDEADSLRRRGDDRGARARLRPAQQIALGHQRDGKRPVADRVEEQHDLIAVVALHDSLAPLLVVYM